MIPAIARDLLEGIRDEVTLVLTEKVPFEVGCCAIESMAVELYTRILTKDLEPEAI